jgi:hypothetical protein
MTETVLPLCCFKITETHEDADAGITKENNNCEVCYTTTLFYIFSCINLMNNNGIIDRKYFIGNVQWNSAMKVVPLIITDIIIIDGIKINIMFTI